MMKVSHLILQPFLQDIMSLSFFVIQDEMQGIIERQWACCVMASISRKEKRSGKTSKKDSPSGLWHRAHIKH